MLWTYKEISDKLVREFNINAKFYDQTNLNSKNKITNQTKMIIVKNLEVVHSVQDLSRIMKLAKRKIF